MIINIKNFNKAYGDNVLFKDAELKIEQNEILALIGQNGRGKTTLIKCISDLEDFEGVIDKNSNLKISVMEQEKDFNKITESYRDFATNRYKVIQDKLAVIEEKLSNYEDTPEYQQLLIDHENLCKNNVSAVEFDKMCEWINQMGFNPIIIDTPVSALSGGQKTALRLADCLSKESDLIIFDEPTNHFDYKSIEWVRRLIKDLKKTVILVSHDRYLIERVANCIVEIENKGFVKYVMPYKRYLAKRIAHRQALQNEHRATLNKKRRLDASISEKREWAHVDGNKKHTNIANRLEKERNNLKETADISTYEDKYNLEFKEDHTAGATIFQIRDFSKKYGDKQIYQNVSFDVERGDKIVILGVNGCGKTSLVKDILKNAVRGANLKIGYISQQFENLPMSQTVLNYVLDGTVGISEYQIPYLLEKFGLSYDIGKKKLKSLSGGEKQRIQIIACMLKEHNVLVLDEPTNHLDLELRESLEEALREFKGTVIFVSHDRYFINEIATHQIILRKNGVEKDKYDKY